LSFIHIFFSVGRRFLRHPLDHEFEPSRERISGLKIKKIPSAILYHGDVVPLYMGGAADFLDLREKVFFLMKYPVRRRPSQIEFFLVLLL
jgi:hypothetical protein